MRTTYTMICEAAKAHGFSINGYGPGLYNVYEQSAPGGWRTLFSGSARECYVWLQGYSQRKYEEERATSSLADVLEPAALEEINHGAPYIGAELATMTMDARRLARACGPGRAIRNFYKHEVACIVEKGQRAKWELDGAPILWSTLLLRLHGFRRIAQGQEPIVEQRA